MSFAVRGLYSSVE